MFVGFKYIIIIVEDLLWNYHLQNDFLEAIDENDEGCSLFIGIFHHFPDISFLSTAAAPWRRVKVFLEWMDRGSNNRSIIDHQQ